jgi:adenine C2-methylase RlmN of 23S rRNA A2503 and tRNA A37
MATHTVIINDKTAKAKHLIALIKEIAKDDQYIEIDPHTANKDHVKRKPLAGVKKQESQYDKEFVKEVQASRKSKGKAIKTADLWK